MHRPQLLLEFMRDSIARSCFTVACLCSLSIHASAQGSVVNLHPPQAVGSEAHGVQGGQLVGGAGLGAGANNHAIVWSVSNGAWVDLHPASSVLSFARAVDQGQQSGHARIGTANHAALWSGSAASWIDLHPPGATVSDAWDVRGSTQFGEATIGGFRHAGIWNGSAASWTDLHPASASQSVCYGGDGGQQVGFARVGTANRASLWTGSASTWVDLAPPGSLSSTAWDVDGGEQVGYAYWSDFYFHAMSWSGTAASYVDLHPPQAGSLALQSWAYGVHAGKQVGEVRFYASPGSSFYLDHASLWSGTASSWEDLHVLLPAAEFMESEARSVWSDASFLYVAGIGKTVNGQLRALLWKRPITPPCGVINGYCTSAPNSFDPNGAVMAAQGSTSVAANDLTLLATGVPPGAAGQFFYGTGIASLPFGNGVLCVTGSIFRLPVTFANAFGHVAFPLDFGALPPGGGIGAGTAWYFQHRFRDVGGAWFNLSNGLSIQFCP